LGELPKKVEPAEKYFSLWGLLGFGVHAQFSGDPKRHEESCLLGSKQE
jgi:hypothetical protein